MTNLSILYFIGSWSLPFYLPDFFDKTTRFPCYSSTFAQQWWISGFWCKTTYSAILSDRPCRYTVIIGPWIKAIAYLIPYPIYRFMNLYVRIRYNRICCNREYLKIIG